MSLLSPPIRFAAFLTLLAGGILALPDLLISDGSAAWAGLYTQEKTLHYFCEPPILHAFIRQPADTFSNLGFLFAGALMLSYGLRDARGRATGFVQRHVGWSYLFGAAMLFTFLGSAFFHASLTRFAEWLDLAAVYSAMWLPVFFNFHLLHSKLARPWLSARAWQILFVLFWALCCLLIFRINSWFTMPPVLLLIGLSSLWVQTKSKGNWKWLALSMFLSLFAIMWFVFDIQRILCWPDSWLQPHAIWHLSDAATALAFYGFMRSHQ